jgi:hypothetical protein
MDPLDHSEVVLCAKCEDNPDDILILTCEHNLCLTCAAKNLHDQEQRQRNSFSVRDPLNLSLALDGRM